MQAIGLDLRKTVVLQQNVLDSVSSRSCLILTKTFLVFSHVLRFYCPFIFLLFSPPPNLAFHYIFHVDSFISRYDYVSVTWNSAAFSISDTWLLCACDSVWYEQFFYPRLSFLLSRNISYYFKRNRVCYKLNRNHWNWLRNCSKRC